MKNKKKLFFISFKSLPLYIFISICLIVTFEDSHIIVIPFKYYKPKINDSKESKQTITFNSWLRQKIYLDMENSAGQKSSMILTLEQMEAHSKEDIALLTTDEIYVKIYTQNLDDICSFNYKNSPNFQCQTPYNVFLHGRDKCCVVEEKYIFYKNEKLSEKEIFPFKLIHSTNQTNICFFGSLQRYTNAVDKSKSLLDQLKILSNAAAYTWTLKYTSDDSGIFIFGDIINNENLMLDKNNKIKNIAENYESIYTSNLFTGRIYWKIGLDKLFLGEEILGENDYIDIDIDSPLILVKKENYRAIKEKIFNQYFEEKICDKIIAEFKLSAITCNKKKFLEKTKNLQNLPSLNFQIRQYSLNLTFTPKELFRIEGDDIYFLVAHHSYKDSQCTIGAIFLKKYPTVFDIDSKQMKILKHVNSEELNNKGSVVKIVLIVFLSIVLSGIIFGFIGLKYGKKIYQARKKKANELEDNFDYTQYGGKNDINFDKKYGLFISNNSADRKKETNEIHLEMTSS
jgi:hypothetical protein